MCTVTFIPAGKANYFTSSRDEQSTRPSAILPQCYEINGTRLVYPKDPKGGGSWMVLHESGNTGVLLNGAMTAHTATGPFIKSRGLILLDIISQGSPANRFDEMDLTGIEPFTVILSEHGNLYSCKWDGSLRWTESLNSNKPQIWSSVTLYDQHAIKKRESWFYHWLEKTPYPGTMDIIRFHQHGGDGDPFNNILMNRNDEVFTNSISSVRITGEAASFRYIDLKTGQHNETILSLQKTISVQS